MSDVKIPHKATSALAALKAQSNFPKGATNQDDYYRALQAMAENEPWTSRIIRAVRSSQTRVDFSQLDDEWLQKLTLNLSKSQLHEY